MRSITVVGRIGLLTLAFVVLLPVPLSAGTTGTTRIYPQGSGATLAFGDYITNPGALNTTYDFFAEVPPGRPRLVLEVNDPDIGLAGAAAEAAGGRDRARGTFNTSSSWSVRKPDGTLIPSFMLAFTTGDATNPAASDDTWFSLMDFTGDAAQASCVNYTASGGTVNWTSNWTETGDDGTAAGGDITATGTAIRFNGSGTLAVGDRIHRDLNLSAIAATTATVRFDYQTRGNYNGQMAVDLCEAGDTNCVPLQTLGTQGTLTTITISVPNGTPTFSATSRLRFRVAATGSNNRWAEFSNVQIFGDRGPQNGHWQISLDMTSAVTGGDDINGIGLRAHDGDSTSGGTEYPLYVDAIVPLGAHENLSTPHPLYPWVTSGCFCNLNDFDIDSDQAGAGNTSNFSATSRDGATAWTIPTASLSPDNTWARNASPAFTTASAATGYGIWPSTFTVTYYGAGGNYATAWFANELAAANPPASKAPANSFRIYFPSDGGAAPLKPYLEQFATFKNTGASNPPVAGQTPRYQITVRLVNPTARAITFSGANLVTANVPGGVVTYVGSSAAVSQGTVVSQPAGGGSGNITWNPGTVAAGSIRILTYTVQVAYAGGTVNVTPTPASGNGTRATFVDGTANTTQARATSTVGPLCQLTIGTLATDAVVSSLDASKDKGRVTVLWTTSSELGAASFDLLRQEKSGFVKVNADPIPALYANAAGGFYAVEDPGANGGRQTWAVQETTTDGRTIVHGPFTVTPRPPQAADPKADGAFGTKPNVSVQSKPKPKAAPKTTATALVAETSARGIHSISASDISTILGMPLGAVEARIRTGSFRLTKGSAAVAWTPSPTGDAILFYAEAIDSPYTTRTAWMLSEGNGTLMQIEPASPATVGATSYFETKWFEVDNFAATAVPLDPEGDYWFQESFVPGYAGLTTKTMPVQIDALASTEDGTLSVRLQGATAATHRVKIRLNDVEVATSTWEGITPLTVTGAIPAGLLRAGSNSVTIEGVKNSGPLSVFYLDAVGVTWQRRTLPTGGRIELDAAGPTRLVGLTAVPTLLDVTDPLRPVALSGQIPDASGNLAWNAVAGHRYAAATTDGIIPASTRASRAADLSGIRAADLLIITSSGIHDAAETYAQYRRSSGLLVEVVDVEAIYDAVTGGLETPHAIRSYLRQASQWPVPPRYVLLAGRGTYDYKGIAGELPLVPPLMVKSPDGIFASDARLADVDGDGAPDFAIGRLPVSDDAELRAYLSKVERFEASQARFPALFASDDPDRGVVFGTASDAMQGTVPFGTSLRINLKDTPLASARAQILGAWASGLSIVNWTGHGGIDRLASEGLLTSTDVPTLTSGTPPVLVALSCVINRFELPNYPTLGEQLILSETGGAAATWAPTGLAYHDASSSLGDAFYRGLGLAPDARVGDLIRAAAASHPGPASELYVLLGDPTLRLRMPVTEFTSRSGE